LNSSSICRSCVNAAELAVVMPALVAGIHVLFH
jgi:hypothetical protein